MYADQSIGTTVGQSVDDAVAYIKSVWVDFLNLFPAILDQQHRAATIAATTPPGFTHDTARAAVDALAFLARVHTSTVRKVEEYGSYIGLSGVLPVAIAAAFSSLALIVVWCFRELEAQKQILDMIQEGTLTPEEAQGLKVPRPSMDILGALFGGLASIGGAGTLLLVGLALLVFARKWRPNPDLLVFRENPDVWSHRVYDLRYRHDDNGEDYVHEFRPGVQMEGLEDGSVRLFHPSRPVWREF